MLIFIWCWLPGPPMASLSLPFPSGPMPTNSIQATTKKSLVLVGTVPPASRIFCESTGAARRVLFIRDAIDGCAKPISLHALAWWLLLYKPTASIPVIFSLQSESNFSLRIVLNSRFRLSTNNSRSPSTNDYSFIYRQHAFNTLQRRHMRSTWTILHNFFKAITRLLPAPKFTMEKWESAVILTYYKQFSK